MELKFNILKFNVSQVDTLLRAPVCPPLVGKPTGRQGINLLQAFACIIIRLPAMRNVMRNARNLEIPERNTEVVASYGIVGSGFLLPEKDKGITKRSIRTRQTTTRRLARALGNIQKNEMQGQKGG
jgi:hypothetical protein